MLSPWSLGGGQPALVRVLHRSAARFHSILRDRWRAGRRAGEQATKPDEGSSSYATRRQQDCVCCIDTPARARAAGPQVARGTRKPIEIRQGLPRRCATMGNDRPAKDAHKSQPDDTMQGLDRGGEGGKRGLAAGSSCLLHGNPFVRRWSRFRGASAVS